MKPQDRIKRTRKGMRRSSDAASAVKYSATVGPRKSLPVSIPFGMSFNVPAKSRSPSSLTGPKRIRLIYWNRFPQRACTLLK